MRYLALTNWQILDFLLTRDYVLQTFYSPFLMLNCLVKSLYPVVWLKMLSFGWQALNIEVSWWMVKSLWLFQDHSCMFAKHNSTSFFQLWRYEFLTNEWKKLEVSGDVPEGLASHTGRNFTEVTLKVVQKLLFLCCWILLYLDTESAVRSGDQIRAIIVNYDTDVLTLLSSHYKSTWLSG